MALYFLFSPCMHSALAHHLPRSLSIVNFVATYFYLPPLRQTKSIRMEADFQIINGPSSAAIPEIIAIKKFKIYLRNITFIGHLSILHSRRMQHTPLGVQFSPTVCILLFVSRSPDVHSVSCAAPLRPLWGHNLLGLPHPCIVMPCQRQQSSITLLSTCALL
jgi:hypothetical protein